MPGSDSMTVNGMTPQPFVGLIAERSWGKKEQNKNTARAGKETMPHED